jgi:recombination protein RecA
VLDMAVDLGIVKKSGAWFTYEGEQLGQGRENAKTFLVENPEVMVEISEKVMVAAGLRPTEGAESAADSFSAADDQPIDIE